MSDEIENRINEQRSNIKEINSKLMVLDADNKNKDEFRTMSTKEEILTVLIVIVVVVFLYYLAK